MSDHGIRLRDAGSGDLDALFDLFAEVQALHAKAHPALFRPPEKDEAFERYVEDLLKNADQRVVLACIDGVPVGYIQYFLGQRPRTIYQPEHGMAYIHGLVVAKDHRGTGCASLLIEHVKLQAERRDISLIGIDCWSFNDAARGCFRKAGFKLAKETMWLGL